MSSLTSSRAWQALRAHQPTLAATTLSQLFASDPQRFEHYSLEVDGLLLDYSKNWVTAETLQLLVALAHERGVEAQRERMFRGEKINVSENRAALHTALRSREAVIVDGEDVRPKIQASLAQMAAFCDAVRSGEIAGDGGQPFTDVVNIGIGGSHLGPALAARALAAYADGPRTHFVSNIDPAVLTPLLATLNPGTTLFVVASKTFTTLETLANAEAARSWARQALGRDVVATHFVGVSENTVQAAAFGIPSDCIFPFWDWVGGRYSLWSTVGLPVALGIGFSNFEALLRGAHTMDEHFRSTPLEHNLPTILALLGIWYNNFFGAQTQAVLPYSDALALLPAYLQQLDMESSGKQITMLGEAVDYDTGTVIWGAPGTDSQHSFFQLLHQGTRLIPADFIAFAQPNYEPSAHHAMLLANFLAQTTALMHGDGKTFPGNHPTNALLLKQLTPHTLGLLIALYEHKVFVQNAIWGINPFDQPGVELGKKLAVRILPKLTGDASTTDLDISTIGLINFYKKNR